MIEDKDENVQKYFDILYSNSFTNDTESIYLQFTNGFPHLPCVAVYVTVILIYLLCIF